MWYRYSQDPNVQTDSNVSELDPNKFRQNIPSGGKLEVELVGGQFNMGPNDPQKQIQIKTSNGTQRTIYILHGTPDGQLVFGDAGNLQSGTADEFKKWLQSKGMPDLPYVSCFGSKIVGSSGGADQLINAAGAVLVGTVEQPNGVKKLIFEDA